MRRTGRDAVPAVLEKFLYADAGGISAVAWSCVRVGGNHLTLRRGLLFPVTRRIPLRFLAGCHIVQTPLQRMTGTCLFFLYSSGCTTLVPGMRKADAECLSAKLTHGGKLL